MDRDFCDFLLSSTFITSIDPASGRPWLSIYIRYSPVGVKSNRDAIVAHAEQQSCLLPAVFSIRFATASTVPYDGFELYPERNFVSAKQEIRN